jgi:2-oxoglutarate/2-oxoacid ferredoxin oxidoreductase subunit beta
MPEVKEYTTPNKPTWCPGCGNFGMWEALKRAFSQLDMEFHDYSIVWGIGCHGNGADFLRTQGSTHCTDAHYPWRARSR